MEWQNKAREKVRRLQDEKRETERQKTQEDAKECTFRPQISELARSLNTEPGDVFERLQRYSALYATSRTRMKEDERRPDPRFSYAPTVTASER